MTPCQELPDMQSDSRLQWIAESVCQSLGVELEAFNALLDDESSSNLLSLFLSGEGTSSFNRLPYRLKPVFSTDTATVTLGTTASYANWV